MIVFRGNRGLVGVCLSLLASLLVPESGLRWIAHRMFCYGVCILHLEVSLLLSFAGCETSISIRKKCKTLSK